MIKKKIIINLWKAYFQKNQNVKFEQPSALLFYGVSDPFPIRLFLAPTHPSIMAPCRHRVLGSWEGNPLVVGSGGADTLLEQPLAELEVSVSGDFGEGQVEVHLTDLPGPDDQVAQFLVA